MNGRYRIPSQPHQVELTIRRSRFLATAAHAPDQEQAKAFIASVRERHADATHNCWAFAAGPPGDSAHIGQSDDGEPHGTAGRPMLNVLLHGDVGEVVVVVTRYFGGIKLGTGGLVRAYSDLTRMVLEDLPCREKVDTVTLRVILAYEHADAVQRLLPEFEAQITAEQYGADAEYQLTLPREHLPALERAVLDITSGLALLESMAEKESASGFSP
ncbi:YigZ family protein [Paucidesulfovibrio gracilis]|nr:YigZ family protein [Paucidesulfovibrio gracilis]